MSLSPDITFPADVIAAPDVDVLLLDQVLEHADVTLAAHQIVEATTDVTYAAARYLDFMTIHSALMDTAMTVRGIPNRIRHAEDATPARMVLGEDDGLPGWSILAEAPGREVVFGAIGVFWTPTISWHDTLSADEFRQFADPGWGKIACNLHVAPYGRGRSILTYECRTKATDDVTRQKFLRYWRVIRPFVRHILGATVKTVGTNVSATPP